MDYIENYFKEKAENVNFIELKDYMDIDLVNTIDIVDLPLPLVSDILAQGIKTGNMIDEVDAEMILDGMIYIVGADRDFKYHKDYIEILKNYNEAIDDYIFFKGIKYFDKSIFDRSDIYFRALVFVNPEHILGRFNYGLALERIAQDYMDKENLKASDAFLKKATYEFETVLDIDENYPLAYYKLGYHYRFKGQFLKAKLMWEKYINLDEDELRIQEVREEILAIDDEVNLEAGLTYLSYNRHDEALEAFLKLMPRHENWWELRYLLGVSYVGLGKVNLAIEEYYRALELNDEVEDVYNELGIELIKENRLEEAIDIYTRAIDRLGNSYKLNFNRGLAYLQLGQREFARRDIDQAYELNPLDDNVKEMKEYFENQQA